MAEQQPLTRPSLSLAGFQSGTLLPRAGTGALAAAPDGAASRSQLASPGNQPRHVGRHLGERSKPRSGRSNRLRTWLTNSCTLQPAIEDGVVGNEDHGPNKHRFHCGMYESSPTYCMLRACVHRNADTMSRPLPLEPACPRSSVSTTCGRSTRMPPWCSSRYVPSRL